MDGSVVYCYLDGNGAGQIASGYIKGFDVLSDLNQGIQLNNQVSFNDSVLSCQWLRIAKTFVNGIEYDLLNNKYHILLAKGNMNGGILNLINLADFGCPHPSSSMAYANFVKKLYFFMYNNIDLDHLYTRYLRKKSYFKYISN